MKYPKAPIREAIFDIYIESLDRLEVKDMEMFYSVLKDKYPNKRVLSRLHGKIAIDAKTENDEITGHSKSSFRGFIFANEKGNRQVQFRVDGFTLNFLAPYSDWEDFYMEAKYLWDIFSKNISDLKIKRIGLRYINRINIPMPFDSFEEYIENMPTIPKVLPQLYKNFFFQIEVPCPDFKYSTIITQTLETATETELPFILDIDVYKNIDEEDFDIEEFNYMREVKNQIFEDFITDKTRLLFNS
ncbi:uncharacterized protein (TIGR04255 family) [Flavobacterium sp. 28YEA47A]|uniref:TIGR04255 family protein n=1 Tax=Flavobacterium sp. 28YEA47A TaxID=3156276 RepID=UPI003511E06A